MKARRRFRIRTAARTSALVLACVVAGGCAARNGGLPTPKPVTFELESWSYRGHEGRKLSTEHYAIYTTLTDEYLLGALTELLETSFGYYRQLVPPIRRPQEKMKVYLFATRPDWEHFTRAFTGPRAAQFLRVRYGGYSETGVSVIQYTAHQTSFPLMAHEGFHQYLYHYFNPHVPAWLNEGLSVVCEGQRWEGRHIKEFDPWHNPLRRNVLAEALLRKRTFGLAELLEMHAGRVLPYASKKIGTYYAQLWMLCLFLREGEDGKYAAGFDRLLSHLSPAEVEQHARAAHIWSDAREFHPGRALFRSFITDDLETFEREYEAFMREKILGGP